MTRPHVRGGRPPTPYLRTTPARAARACRGHIEPLHTAGTGMTHGTR